MSNDWSTDSWRPPSDNSSYFDKINERKINEIRTSVAAEIRQEAGKILHNIVTQKDKEINDLKITAEKYQDRITQQQKEIESLKREKRHFDIPEDPEFIPEDIEKYIEASPQEFLQGLTEIIKYGKSLTGYSQPELEKIRKTIMSWKTFLEQYKWKSNYISVKIKKLLLDTEKIWEE